MWFSFFHLPLTLTYLQDTKPTERYNAYDDTHLRGNESLPKNPIVCRGLVFSNMESLGSVGGCFRRDDDDGERTLDDIATHMFVGRRTIKQSIC